MSMSEAPITIEVLPDGSVKITTSKIDPAAHVRAERFLAEVAKLLGGTTTRTKRTHGHHHHHDHEGDHDHDHDHSHA